MKKLFNTAQLVAVVVMFVTNANFALAQCTHFIPAVTTESTTDAGNIASTSESGNDSRRSGSLGSMEVNVWGGSNAGLGWNDGTNASRLYFSGTTYDPDVSLVEGYSNSQTANTWFAIVVYGDASSNLTCDFYEWDLTSTTFATIAPITTYLESPGFWAYVNVDADASFNFVVVWDFWNSGAGQSEVHVACGTSVPGTSPPGFCGGYPILLPGSAGQFAPDVSLYPDFSNSTSVVHYACLDAGLGRIYITYDDFNSLCGGTSSNNADWTATPPVNCYWDSPPRIACPPNTNGSATTDWSMVSTVNCSGTHDVIGYTSYNPPGNGYAPYRWDYTNASVNANLCRISPNRFPVVSYDAGYNGIMIGWICEYDRADLNHMAHPAFNDIAPVALLCDLKGGLGGPAPSCYPSNTPWYMIVQSDNLTQGTLFQEYTLSISGRDYNSMQYTFFNSATSDIQFKDVDRKS